MGRLVLEKRNIFFFEREEGVVVFTEAFIDEFRFLR